MKQGMWWPEMAKPSYHQAGRFIVELAPEAIPLYGQWVERIKKH
jgi:hypothetical protein